jgi:Replication-relaxation
MDTALPSPTRYRSDRYRRTKARQLANPLAFQPGREILAALGRYGYLTTDQVRRLLYSPGSGTFVSEWLKTLGLAGLTHDNNWLRLNPTGKNPRVWTFTEKGRRLAVKSGETELPGIHHQRVPQPWVLDHLIAVNEALVTCELLARKSDGVIELLGLRSDEMLHKMPITIELKGKRQDVVPDGWVAYGFEGKPYRSFCLELDRGTEVVTKWRAKIRAYVAALSGKPSAYTKLFGFEGATVMTVVRPKEGVRIETPEKRIHDLKTWTEAELTELNRRSWAPLFRFTTLAPEETDPMIFFGAPFWLTPFDDHKTPLWEGVL